MNELFKKWSKGRNVFLVGVVFIVNAYLVGYGADAVLSTADALINALTGFQGLSDARETLANIVFFLSFPVLLFLIFVPQLPARILVVPILFLIWVDLGAFPFTIGAVGEVVLPLAQLGAFAGMVWMLNRSTGLWLLAPEKLPHKTHLIRRTLIALAATIVLLPFVVSGLAMLALVGAIEQQTGGFLHFDATGIDATESVLQKGGKTVDLIGMVHIGDPAFYRKVYDAFPPGALVLMEGVTDRTHLLTQKLSYERVASAIGLGQQPQFQQLLETQKTQADAAKQTQAAKPSQPETAEPNYPNIVDADIDISDFTPTTLRFINWVSEIYSTASLTEAITKFTTGPQPVTQDDLPMVLDDIIQKRNAKLIAEFDKQSADYMTVVIPWGAEHMPGIEAALEDRGYRVQTKHTIRVADYATIFRSLAHH